MALKEHTYPERHMEAAMSPIAPHNGLGMVAKLTGEILARRVIARPEFRHLPPHPSPMLRLFGGGLILAPDNLEARLAAEVRAKIEAELAYAAEHKCRQYAGICYSSDYHPDRELKEIGAAVGIPDEVWPSKMTVWVHFDPNLSERCTVSTRGETHHLITGAWLGWLTGPENIPPDLYTITIEAILAGRLPAGYAWTPEAGEPLPPLPEWRVCSKCGKPVPAERHVLIMENGPDEYVHHECYPWQPGQAGPDHCKIKRGHPAYAQYWPNR